MDLSKKYLKVCKIDDANFGKFAILCGADYLGVHVLEEKDIGSKKDLIDYLVALNGGVVIVTKITNFDLLNKIINLHHPYGIQIHCRPDPDLIKKLKDANPTIKIFSVVTGDLEVNLIERVSDLSEYLIYDSSYVGGTGKKNPLALIDKLKKEIKDKIFIAGGVNSSFLKKHKNLDVAGFDIQSYFRENDELHYDRVEEISRLIKGPKKGLLSVSVTDCGDVENITKEYADNPHYNYHLDYSDGSLYGGFVTEKNEMVEKLSIMKNVPLDIHIFSRDEDQINNLINEFKTINSYSISSFFIQYFPQLNLNRFDQINNLTISVYYKDFEDYFNKWTNFTDYLSVILPSEDIEKAQIVFDYMGKNKPFFLNKEIWFDRKLNEDKILQLKKIVGIHFNVIVGKEITRSQKTIKEIHEQFSL